MNVDDGLRDASEKVKLQGAAPGCQLGEGLLEAVLGRAGYFDNFCVGPEPVRAL